MKRLAILALVASCAAASASAQMQCGQSDQVDTQLESAGYQIAVSGRAGDAYVETHANPGTGQFLIIARRDNGLSCLLAAGDGFNLYRWGTRL